MNAAILAVGDEIVLGQNLDTNTAWLADQLLARSIIVLEHRTVADDRAAHATAIRELCARHDLLIMTGGLGPTEDDLTRVALGDVLTPDEELVLDDEAKRSIEGWFTGRGKSLREVNLVQAHRPRTMHILANPNGTAPGLAGGHDGCLVFALPGPPREMKPMFLEQVAPVLPESAGEEYLAIDTVQLYGLGESDAASRLGDLTRRDRNPVVGTTASEGIISARIRARGDRAGAQRKLESTIRTIEDAWKPYAFGRGETTLARAVGELLRQQSRSLATAESCTGGWLGKMIVDVAGSSDYYRGGWVTYSDRMKVCCLGVPEALLQAHGAVSRETAAAMAEGALERGRADEALAITGVAGPGGGGPGKPAGMVFVALARREGAAMQTLVRQFRFRGDRGAVRDRSAKCALQMLRFALLGVDDTLPLLWEIPRREPGKSLV